MISIYVYIYIYIYISSDNNVCCVCDDWFTNPQSMLMSPCLTLSLIVCIFHPEHWSNE